MTRPPKNQTLRKAYKRGDPDPTPASMGSGIKCPHRIEVPGHEDHEHPKNYYECTWRDDKHDPYQHVAGGMNGKVLFVWGV